MVGPIYSTGKIADERVHHFTQGYQAPMSAEQKAEKMRLIKKHFEKQQKAIGSLHDKVVSKVTSLQQQTEVRSHSESRVSREEALRLGENRRQEAVQRRQQFLQQERESRATMSQRERMASQQERFLVQQEEQRLEEGGGQRQVCQAWQQSNSQQQTWMEQTSSQQVQSGQARSQQTNSGQFQQISQTRSVDKGVESGSKDKSALEEAARRLTATVKSRQQLEAERDAMVNQTVQKYQMEASIMAERQQAEEKQRLDALEQERQRQVREEMERVERAKRLEEERLQRVKAEQEKIKASQAERRRVEEAAREKARMEAEEKQRQAEKQAGDKRKREETQRRQQEEDARRQRKQDEENRAAQKREQEELRRAQQQQQHVEVNKSALWSPQVARRTDDVHGLGFGQVLYI